MINERLNGMFGKVAPGMCRLSMDGNIAVKTSTGYKSYNTKTGSLINCNDFVFNIGEEFFFVIPTNKVKINDIILVHGKPNCVLNVEMNKLTVINYEDSTINTIIPERHMFMGNTYFYGKIVSMFGEGSFNGKNNTNKIMQYMMISEMFKGSTSNDGSTTNMNMMMPFMLMNGTGMANMFDGMFNLDDDTDEESVESEEE